MSKPLNMSHTNYSRLLVCIYCALFLTFMQVYNMYVMFQSLFYRLGLAWLDFLVDGWYNLYVLIVCTVSDAV